MTAERCRVAWVAGGLRCREVAAGLERWSLDRSWFERRQVLPTGQEITSARQWKAACLVSGDRQWKVPLSVGRGETHRRPCKRGPRPVEQAESSGPAQLPRLSSEGRDVHDHPVEAPGLQVARLDEERHGQNAGVLEERPPLVESGQGEEGLQPRIIPAMLLTGEGRHVPVGSQVQRVGLHRLFTFWASR